MFGYKKYNYNRETVENDIREFNGINETPEVSVLSNGKYSIVINDRGQEVDWDINLGVLKK